jgi:ribose/xylose/arabinose/galactoside ABC-type transport system permease subunit
VKVQSAEAAKTRSRVSRRLEAQSGLLAIFLVLILLIILSSIISPTFRTGLNAQNVSRQAVALGLVSLGQTFVILGGGIDLSAGSVISLVSCLSAGIMMGQPERLAPVLLGMVLLGTLIGVFNGLLVTRLRVAPFIVTLGTMSIVQGLVFLYTKNPVGKIPKAFRFLAEGQIGPIPFPVILFAVLTLIALFVLRRTIFGRYVYATGGNEEVARLSGINTSLIKIATYVVGSLAATATGLFLTSRLRIGQPLVGQGYELDSITAVLIGGTALSGGRGGVIGTVIGVLIMIVLNNILNLMNVTSYWQWIVKGSIIILALAIQRDRR